MLVLVEGRQVGRAADQAGHFRGQHLQHFARRVPRRQLPSPPRTFGRPLRQPRRELVTSRRVPVGGQLRVRLAPVRRTAAATPRIHRVALRGGLQEQLPHHLRDEEGGLQRQAQRLLRRDHLVLAQGLPVGGRGVLLLRAALADVGVADDEAGPILHLLRRLDRRRHRRPVVPIDLLHVPTVGLEALLRVLPEGEVGAALDADVVVVIQVDDPSPARGARRARPPRARYPPSDRRRSRSRRCSDRRSLAPSTLYFAAAICCASAIPTPFAKPWPSGPVVVSMPRIRSCSGCPGVHAADLAEVPCRSSMRHLVPGQMQQRVQQHRAVARRRARSDRGWASCGSLGLWRRYFVHST